MFGARRSYAAVLVAAGACYAALGAVVRIAPHYVGRDLTGPSVLVGVAIGAPALAAIFTRPLGGRIADRRGTGPVVAAGGAAMAVVSLLMFWHTAAGFVGARLAVGIGEGAMMSASVLWLLRLAGPARRGRALGHIGLANYAGLTIGPLLADVLGGPAHPNRVFVLAVALPLVPAALVPFIQRGEVPDGTHEPAAIRHLARSLLGPGVGLLLVNVGYAALLSFGGQALSSGQAALLPLYALAVIAVRTIGGSVPDRLGGRTTLLVAAPVSAAGLVTLAFAPAVPLQLAGVLVLGAGQGLAVPALGLLALSGVRAADHGAASGVFFAWFDAGVGVGGPLSGAAAGIGGPEAALAVAAAAVAAATGVVRLRSAGAPVPAGTRSPRPRVDRA